MKPKRDVWGCVLVGALLLLLPGCVIGLFVNWIASVPLFVLLAVVILLMMFHKPPPTTEREARDVEAMNRRIKRGDPNAAGESDLPEGWK